MFSSERLFRFFALIYSVLMPVEVWAMPMPTKQVEVRVADEVRVHSDRVVLGDVATIYAKSIRDFERLSSLVITQMPADGKELRISAGYLKQRVAEALGGTSNFALHSSETVTFLKESLGLDPQDIAKTILANGLESGKIPSWAEADIVPVSGFDQLISVRGGNYRIEAGVQKNEWRGNMPFKVVLGDGKVIWLRAKIRWFAHAWVANRQVSIQEALGPESFRKERVEITDLADEVIRSDQKDLESALKTARARKLIRERAVLTKNMIDRRPDASPGQRMKVVFVSGSGLRVSADGSLISPAVIGENARVRLNSSRKVVVGKLVAEGIMEINL